MWECEDCGAEYELDADIEEGQIVECLECGAEFEVASLDPLELQALDLPVSDDDEADGDGDTSEDL